MRTDPLLAAVTQSRRSPFHGCEDGSVLIRCPRPGPGHAGASYASGKHSVVRALAPLNLVYLDVAHSDDDPLHTLRKLWPTMLLLIRVGTYIAIRAKDIEDGRAGIVTVGTMALANPDLVERLRIDAPLNTPAPAAFHGGCGGAGSTGYPTHTA